jgi:hypothetical protein
MAGRAQPPDRGLTHEDLRRAAHRALGDGALYTTVVGKPERF